MARGGLDRIGDAEQSDEDAVGGEIEHGLAIRAHGLGARGMRRRNGDLSSCISAALPTAT